MKNMRLSIHGKVWRALPVLALAVFFLADCAPSHAWLGRVLLVPDGDTVYVSPAEGGPKVRVRLYGVDCPEFAAFSWKAQPYCRRARDFVREMLPAGLTVTVLALYTDRYGREVGSVIVLPDGRIVQEELLKAGLAWVDPRYCKGCRQWKRLEMEARRDRLGLWREEDPSPPWKWRKRPAKRTGRAVAQ